MVMVKRCIVAAICAATVLLGLAGCGGKGMRLSTGLGTDAAPSPVASKYAQATQTGLTTQFHFTYNTAGYPSTPDGSLSVVALRDELTPDPASKSSYGITAQATTGSGQFPHGAQTLRFSEGVIVKYAGVT
jgi:hypothetical protein